MSAKELDAAGIRDPALRASYEACRRLNASHGKTYYLATLLLPAWKRPYVHALYGFARYADEIVDDLGSTLSDAEKADWLVGWGEQFVRDVEAGGSDHPISRAVVDTVRRWDVPMHYVEAFLASMRMDLTVTQYETYDDLMTYVYGSAAVIGLEMVPVLEPVVPREIADPYAARPRHRLPAEQLRPRRRRGPAARPGLPADGGPARVRRHARAPRARRGRRAGAPAARLRGRPHARALPQRRGGRAPAAPDEPAVHRDGARALRRHPRRGRAGRLRRAGPAGRRRRGPPGRRRPPRPRPRRAARRGA